MSNIKMFSNLSQKIREIDYLEKAVLKDIGDAIAEAVWKEFEILVIETAQYSGTTAASWNLSMGGDHSVHKMPDPKTKQGIRRVGHMTAVAAALNRNFSKLDEITTKYRTTAIVVENHAPGAEVAEFGPLRLTNQEALGAFARFESRVATTMTPIVRSRTL